MYTIGPTIGPIDYVRPPVNSFVRSLLFYKGTSLRLRVVTPSPSAVEKNSSAFSDCKKKLTFALATRAYVHAPACIIALFPTPPPPASQYSVTPGAHLCYAPVLVVAEKEGGRLGGREEGREGGRDGMLSAAMHV